MNLLYSDRTGRRGLTLVEIVIAVAIFSIATIRMIGTLHSQYRRTQYVADTRVYADRAQDIMVDMIERVPFRVIIEAMGDKGHNSISSIRSDVNSSHQSPGSGAELPNQGEAISFEDLRVFRWTEDGEEHRLINIDDISSDTGDTVSGRYKIDTSNRTYFQSKGRRFYFELSILSQPMYMYYRPHELVTVPPQDRPSIVTARDIRYEPALTLSRDASEYRDMLLKVILTISWESFDQQNSYSYVTYRANLGGDYDNV